jgi:hypothetical protein
MARGSRDDGVVDAISHQLASGIDAQVQRFSFLSRVIQFQPPQKGFDISFKNSCQKME